LKSNFVRCSFVVGSLDTIGASLNNNLESNVTGRCEVDNLQEGSSVNLKVEGSVLLPRRVCRELTGSVVEQDEYELSQSYEEAIDEC
jgi:hypothetical protein